MAIEEFDYGGSELGEVQVTVVVTPLPGRRRVKTFPAQTRIRVGLVLLGLLAAGAAAAIIAVPHSAPSSHGPSRSTSSQSSTFTNLYGVRTPFEIPMHCLRLTLISPDGTYARADYDHAGQCGTYGNYITIVWHRVHGAWVRAFDASSRECPTTSLPPRVLAELQLCPAIATPARPVARPRAPSRQLATRHALPR